jgi:hypothetical protein
MSFSNKKSDFMLLFQVANEVILRLDKDREHRTLSAEETKLCAFLKGKCLAMALPERTQLR